MKSLNFYTEPAKKLAHQCLPPHTDRHYRVNVMCEQPGGKMVAVGRVVCQDCLGEMWDSEERGGGAKVRVELAAGRKIDTTFTDGHGVTMTLTDGVCYCGNRVQLWLRDGQALICGDCRDSENRRVNGWTPANSVD